MKPLKILRRGAAVLVTALGLTAGTSGGLLAADATPPPAPAVVVYDPGVPVTGCPTCEPAPVAAGCQTGTCQSPTCGTCAKAHHGWRHRECVPYQTRLCPGACFGYFQTQWHRWDNVCPIPYQGVGLSDAPAVPTPAAAGIDRTGSVPPRAGSDASPIPPKGKGNDTPTAPNPMPLKKPSTDSSLPPIPPLNPGNPKN